jgi:hypothetical protein
MNLEAYHRVPLARSMAAAAILIGVAAFAQDPPCEHCGPVVDPETANWLAWEGYPLESYALVLSWEEGGREPPTLTTGYRVAPLDGGPAVDIYRDASWTRLGEWDLAVLGIAPKRWDAAPVTQAPEINPGWPKLRPAFPEIPREVRIATPAQRVIWPELDTRRVLEEDRAAHHERKGALRYGVFRDVPAPLVVRGPGAQHGWRTAADGSRVYSILLELPGAAGMRVHVAKAEGVRNAEFYLHNAENVDEQYGPMPVTDDFWTPSCFGDRVVLTCRLPAGAAADALFVEVDRVSHLYRELDTLPFAKIAGACNLDVACYPAWATTALGVGGIGSIDLLGRASIWCTGSLLADDDPATTVPYFVTATHCVGSQSQAAAIEVFWLYQTPTCGEAPPSLAAVPRTSGGADLLATVTVSLGTDFTLLRLKNPPPAGLVYLGFSTEAQPLEAEVTCIHHPRGDFKRISFGTLVDSGSPSSGNAPLQPRTRFHEVLWHDGTTEPGSSGSPLLTEAGQLFIGQLWGGRASCSLPEEPDYYGRFDVSFPLVEQWLVTGNAYDADVDGSGEVNAVDLQLAVNAALGGAVLGRADVDRNGVVDARDVQLVVRAILRF